MPKTKKKVRLKKSRKKSFKKGKTKRRVAILSTKKLKKNKPESSDSIFDSQINKTDALFIDEKVNTPEDFDPIRDVPVKPNFFKND